MKFPNHILIDLKPTSLIFNNQYWTHFFVINYETNSYRKKTFFLHKLINLQNKFFFTKLLEFKANFKNTSIRENAFSKKQIPNLLEKKNQFLFKNFKQTIKNRFNNLQSLFLINFLRKEKLYTKLKYSRVPQYDAVSGGAAALFAGFLGFLICEKFGFELLDSGDFYFIFMYFVFLIFFSGLLVKIMTKKNYLWNILNFKFLFLFTFNVIRLFLNFFKKLFNYFY